MASYVYKLSSSYCFPTSARLFARNPSVQGVPAAFTSHALLCAHLLPAYFMHGAIVKGLRLDSKKVDLDLKCCVPLLATVRCGVRLELL